MLSHIQQNARNSNQGFLYPSIRTLRGNGKKIY